MADDGLATWKSIAKRILKPQILPRHSPEEVTPNSTSKRDIWEVSGLGGLLLVQALACLARRGAWSRGLLLLN